MHTCLPTQCWHTLSLPTRCCLQAVSSASVTCLHVTLVANTKRPILCTKAGQITTGRYTAARGAAASKQGAKRGAWHPRGGQERDGKGGAGVCGGGVAVCRPAQGVERQAGNEGGSCSNKEAKQERGLCGSVGKRGSERVCELDGVAGWTVSRRHSGILGCKDRRHLRDAASSFIMWAGGRRWGVHKSRGGGGTRVVGATPAAQSAPRRTRRAMRALAGAVQTRQKAAWALCLFMQLTEGNQTQTKFEGGNARGPGT